MINKSTNDDSLTGAFEAFLSSIKKRMENCIPCKITAINPERTKVSVQPMIMIISRDASQIKRSEIKGIHVNTFGAGDTLISFPIKVGDLGWIEASDRDIGLFLQSFGNSAPPSKRMHSFSDARFIPDIMHNFAIAEEDSAALTIQNRDGTTKIALDQNEIRITSSGVVKINGGTVDESGNFITSGGISLDNHTHPYTWSDPAGSGNTGEPS